MLQIQVVNITISMLTSAVSMLLAVRALRQRHVQGALWFVGLVSAVAWVTWWYTFEAAASTNLEAYVSLSKLEYVGLTFIPFLWLGFALNFSGRERFLSPVPRILLAVIPVVTILLAFTNEYTGLIYKQPHFDMTYGAPVFAPEYGAWFWIFVVYSYVIFMVGSVVLIRYALNTWRLYRVQALLILIGTAFPWLSNLMDIFHSLNPFPYLYLNAVFLGTSIACFAFALLRLRLLDIAPVAYDTILNNVPEGLVVVDLQNRILAINSYVKSFLDDPRRDPIGRAFTDAFSQYASYFETLRETTDYKGELQVNDHVFEIRISLVFDRQAKQRGRLFVISDITAKAQIEQAQRAEQLFSEMMQKIGRTLNSSLDTVRVMSLILESLDEFIPHSCSNIMLVDDNGYTTRVLDHRGYSRAEAAKLDKMVFDYRNFPLFMRSAQTAIPFVVPDIDQEPDWIGVEGLENVHSFASMPLLMDGKLAGFINIDGQLPGAIKPEMVNRLQIFGQQAALAIKNARLYEETYRQAEELKRRVNSLTITQHVYKEIGFSLNIKSLLELAIDATLRISAADAGYVALAKGDELELAQFYGNYDQKRLISIVENRFGIIEDTILKRRMRVIQSPGIIVSGLSNTQGQIALPLFARGEAVTENFYGIIVLETDDPQRFTEDRIQLLSLIADRVAVAFHNVRLINTVRERAAELEILYDKVSYLENFKSDMIRIAAHDLKNPLNVIRNYLTMLVDNPEIELDLDKVYPSMLRSSERMLSIIQNFLSLDRIEKAAEQHTIEPFDLSSVVSKAVDEFTPRAEQKSQQLTAIIPDYQCEVMGDPEQVYEAITNFISNGVKYTPAGGHITVSLVAEAGFAQFEVQDNGYGIPEDRQEKLFQPFYRARTSETEGVEGSGLGLHLTKNIIERQGGKVIFHSVYQKGSTFGFQLPLYQPEGKALVSV